MHCKLVVRMMIKYMHTYFFWLKTVHPFYDTADDVDNCLNISSMFCMLNCVKCKLNCVLSQPMKNIYMFSFDMNTHTHITHYMMIFYFQIQMLRQSCSALNESNQKILSGKTSMESHQNVQQRRQQFKLFIHTSYSKFFIYKSDKIMK